MKVDIEYLEFLWPIKTYLITCGNAALKANIIAVSFCMPAAGQPPQIICSIGKAFYSYELIEQSGEFAVNVPTKALQKAVYYCGTHSGRDVDKFKETGLTPLPARRLKTPIIAECIAHMECVVVGKLDTKPYTKPDLKPNIANKALFLGEVIEAYADEAYASGELKVEHLLEGGFPRHAYGLRFK
jgi:flavin reductase (DIM6/NTAB) family NADH-FMN oxidoreductase RutF